MAATGICPAADPTGAGRARLLALAAYATGSLPLQMQVNLRVTSPNNGLAAHNDLDCKVRVGGTKIASGATT